MLADTVDSHCPFAGGITVQVGRLDSVDDLPYRPACLPASNRIEHIRNALLKWSVHSNATGYPSPSLVAHGFRMHFEDLDALMSDFEKSVGASIKNGAGTRAWGLRSC